ncbi:hypothetical protein [Methanobrevibacter sp.]|uniref:hypothetical protein n=1 Tax=Methanobrevibacter sp. TaxID=66852 RepID=UPI0038702C3D
MSIVNPKSKEIKRLTSPLTFKDFKAYDSQGNLLKCSETLSDVRFIVEPKENILNEDEILQYAPESKSASQIRLKRGFGGIKDVLCVHESLPWILGLFYVVLISIAIPVTFSKNMIGMYLILVLVILPLLYLYYIFNFKKHTKYTVKKPVKELKKVETPVQTTVEESSGLESLKKYEKEINNLKVLFNVKEEVVRELIEKRFEPPQITYDKFISSIDNCHKLFYAQSDAALNIINLAVEDTPRVQDEIKNKIDAMKTIINQIEDLTNELVINISSSNESEDEVKNLLDDMENLIDSVKEY